MRISDWSSDVCSSDLIAAALAAILHPRRLEFRGRKGPQPPAGIELEDEQPPVGDRIDGVTRAARGAQRPDKRPDRATRSEERRVGKECVMTRGSRWSTYH